MFLQHGAGQETKVVPAHTSPENHSVSQSQANLKLAFDKWNLLPLKYLTSQFHNTLLPGEAQLNKT